MDHHFGIGLAFKHPPAGDQFVTQFLEILDNAVVHQRHQRGGVRVGIGLRRRTVGGPAGVGDADMARRRIALQLQHQIGELAFRPAAHQFPARDGADARTVIAAIFHPLEPIDKALRDGLVADNTDNSAH